MTTIDTAPDTAPAIIPHLDTESTKGRKLAIICSKGSLDMTYPELTSPTPLSERASRPTCSSFWGFDISNKKTMADLKFTPLGNTATHMPQGLGGLPGITHMATSKLKKSIADLDVPEVPRVPRADRRVRRSPVGVPDVGGHEPPHRGRSL